MYWDGATFPVFIYDPTGCEGHRIARFFLHGFVARWYWLGTDCPSLQLARLEQRRINELLVSLVNVCRFHAGVH